MCVWGGGGHLFNTMYCYSTEQYRTPLKKKKKNSNRKIVDYWCKVSSIIHISIAHMLPPGKKLKTHKGHKALSDRRVPQLDRLVSRARRQESPPRSPQRFPPILPRLPSPPHPREPRFPPAPRPVGTRQVFRRLCCRRPRRRKGSLRACWRERHRFHDVSVFSQVMQAQPRVHAPHLWREGGGGGVRRTEGRKE